MSPLCAIRASVPNVVWTKMNMQDGHHPFDPRPNHLSTCGVSGVRTCTLSGFLDGIGADPLDVAGEPQLTEAGWKPMIGSRQGRYPQHRYKSALQELRNICMIKEPLSSWSGETNTGPNMVIFE